MFNNVAEQTNLDDALNDAVDAYRDMEPGSEEAERQSRIICNLAKIRIEDFNAAVNLNEKEEARKAEDARAKEQLKFEIIKLMAEAAGFGISVMLYLYLNKQCLNLEAYGTLSSKRFAEIRRDLKVPNMKI